MSNLLLVITTSKHSVLLVITTVNNNNKMEVEYLSYWLKFWLFSQITYSVIPLITVGDQSLSVLNFVISLGYLRNLSYVCYAVSCFLIVFFFLFRLVVH